MRLKRKIKLCNMIMKNTIGDEKSQIMPLLKLGDNQKMVETEIFLHKHLYYLGTAWLNGLYL